VSTPLTNPVLRLTKRTCSPFWVKNKIDSVD
jgi:hypothetical protein